MAAASTTHPGARPLGRALRGERTSGESTAEEASESGSPGEATSADGLGRGALPPGESPAATDPGLVLLSEAVRRLRRLGADHVEVRHVEEERLVVAARNGALEQQTHARSAGFAVRLLVRGAWGFAARAGSPTDEASLDAAAKEALTLARQAAALPRPAASWVRLAEAEPARGTWATPVEEDPFLIPPEEQVALVTNTCRALADRIGARATVRATRAHIGARRQRIRLATSEGTALTQLLTSSAAGMSLLVERNGIQAERSWPMSLDGGVGGGGFERVRSFDLPGHVDVVVDEALQLLAAPLCPPGRRTVILDTPQLALQIHESCGHPTELDRALGEELSLAGGSFLGPERLGRVRYGSRLVNLVADARTPGGLGTFGWDDEGTPARRTPLVARGQHVGYLTTRETAPRVGLPASGGCLRAESWRRVPILRMTNVHLEPDPAGPTLEELIADTADGILFGSNRSWSIDDLRLNFQFGCEIAWEIQRGRRTRVLRNPVYTGTTPRFWSGCNAVGGPEAFELWGFASCGKGDPMQLVGVGHGCPPARFVDVEVGHG